MARPLTVNQLVRENCTYQGTGGVSAENRCAGFRPAFLDRATGTIYLSRNPDGSIACFHRLDGLPDAAVDRRDQNGRIVCLKSCIVAGFERDGRFYSRDEAAALLGPLS